VTLNKYQRLVLLFAKQIAMWAPQGSIIIDVTSETRTTGVSFFSLEISQSYMTLMYCSATCEVGLVSIKVKPHED
jgi:hypothetical protein